MRPGAGTWVASGLQQEVLQHQQPSAAAGDAGGQLCTASGAYEQERTSSDAEEAGDTGAAERAMLAGNAWEQQGGCMEWEQFMVGCQRLTVAVLLHRGRTRRRAREGFWREGTRELGAAC